MFWCQDSIISGTKHAQQESVLGGAESVCQAGVCFGPVHRNDQSLHVRVPTWPILHCNVHLFKLLVPFDSVLPVTWHRKRPAGCARAHTSVSRLSKRAALLKLADLFAITCKLTLMSDKTPGEEEIPNDGKSKMTFSLQFLMGRGWIELLCCPEAEKMYEMRENCCKAKDSFTSIFGTRAGLVETFTLFVVVAGQFNYLHFSSSVSCI